MSDSALNINVLMVDYVKWTGSEQVLGIDTGPGLLMDPGLAACKRICA